MNSDYGPYIQMGKLAEKMATQYQKDHALEMKPLVAHFIDEVEINLFADDFNHEGFIDRICGPLRVVAAACQAPRKKEFLTAIVEAVAERGKMLPVTEFASDDAR